MSAPDLFELQKQHDRLAGRVDELRDSCLNGFQAQLNQMQDRMNRQELYIKELLQSSHSDRLNVVETMKNLEISITRTIGENIKTLELAYKQDRDKQSGFNMLTSQRISQGVIVVAVGWFLIKDIISGG